MPGLHASTLGHAVQVRKKYPGQTSHPNLCGAIEKLLWAHLIRVSLKNLSQNHERLKTQKRSDGMFVIFKFPVFVTNSILLTMLIAFG
jgi:hypothetical protein